MGKIFLFLISITSIFTAVAAITFPDGSEQVLQEISVVLNIVITNVSNNPVLSSILGTLIVPITYILSSLRSLSIKKETLTVESPLTDRALAKAVRDKLIDEQIFLENIQQRAKEELVKLRIKYLKVERELIEAQEKYREIKQLYDTKKKEFTNRDIELVRVDNEIEKISKSIDKLTIDIHKSKEV